MSPRVARPIVVALVASIGTVGCATAYVKPGPGPVVNASPESVPRGTLVGAQINQPISTATNHRGDRFTAQLMDPLVDGDGRKVVDRGAQIDGVVSSVQRAPTAAQQPGIRLDVVGVEQPGAGVVEMPVEVAESPVETTPVWGYELLGGVLGTGAGAAVGVGLNHNSIGVVVGAALVGTGLGTLAAWLFSPRDATIPSGTVVTLRLTHDVTVQKPVAAQWNMPAAPSLPSAATPAAARAPVTAKTAVPVAP